MHSQFQGAQRKRKTEFSDGILDFIFACSNRGAYPTGQVSKGCFLMFKKLERRCSIE